MTFLPECIRGKWKRKKFPLPGLQYQVGVKEDVPKAFRGPVGGQGQGVSTWVLGGRNCSYSLQAPILPRSLLNRADQATSHILIGCKGEL